MNNSRVRFADLEENSRSGIVPHNIHETSYSRKSFDSSHRESIMKQSRVSNKNLFKTGNNK